MARQGFALGGTNGYFCVYEKTDDKREPFVHIKTLKQGDDTITGMTVTPSDETLVSYSQQSMLRAFPLSTIDTLSESKNHFYSVLPNGIHTRAVTCTSSSVAW